MYSKCFVIEVLNLAGLICIAYTSIKIGIIRSRMITLIAEASNIPRINQLQYYSAFETTPIIILKIYNSLTKIIFPFKTLNLKMSRPELSIGGIFMALFF